MRVPYFFVVFIIIEEETWDASGLGDTECPFCFEINSVTTGTEYNSLPDRYVVSKLGWFVAEYDFTVLPFINEGLNVVASSDKYLNVSTMFEEVFTLLPGTWEDSTAVLVIVSCLTMSFVVEVIIDDLPIFRDLVVEFPVSVIDVTAFLVFKEDLTVNPIVDEVCIQSTLENLMSKNRKPAIGWELDEAHLISNKSWFVLKPEISTLSLTTMGPANEKKKQCISHKKLILAKKA